MDNDIKYDDYKAKVKEEQGPSSKICKRFY